jgi:hypothetical protein
VSDREQTSAQNLARRRQQEYDELDRPHVRQQLILDRLWQAKLDAEAPLDDGYITIGGFRERRTRYGFNKHWRDPDFDAH